MFDIKKEVLQAEQRIRKYIYKTPLIYAHQLSLITGINLYLKLENLQPTNSFKIRGAFNKLLSLTEGEKTRGIVTASSGNHGAAVAFGCHHLNIKGTICIPKTTSPAKINTINSYDAEIQFYGDEPGETEQYARKYAEKNKRVYISPYNDIDVVAGQGTIGYELLQQLDKIDAILVPVGGGGLISGIAGYIKSMRTDIKVIGCLPENSPAMFESIKAGKIVQIETKPTLSDGTVGNNDLDAITFEFCRDFVDDYLLVSEQEIMQAMRLYIEKEHLLLEGSAGVGIAALLKNKDNFKNKNVVAIICGANISMDTLRKIFVEIYRTCE